MNQLNKLLVVSFVLASLVTVALNGCSKQLPTPQNTLCSLTVVEFKSQAEVDSLSPETLRDIVSVNCNILLACDPDRHAEMCSE